MKMMSSQEVSEPDARPARVIPSRRRTERDPALSMRASSKTESADSNEGSLSALRRIGITNLSFPA